MANSPFENGFFFIIFWGRGREEEGEGEGGKKNRIVSFGTISTSKISHVHKTAHSIPVYL
eukprot:TRINITY_DN8279_c0_g1_i1.p1 TRINITY_DN8279_c0_g1~~TRINITY_DN8279_c0_g1_i1.p1  ORF type:complete len:60 (-),score=13.47 TRINITY_DN8279_c0_g1_i1:81-260(-)